MPSPGRVLSATGARWAAVLGDPIGHSLSPVLHRAAYAALGLGWSYTARSVPAARLAAELAGARADADFAGFSLTMPLKAAAVPLLDRLATPLDVVNTVIPVAGELVGHNTDVAGVRAALRAVAAAAGPALVLGSGGTSRAAVAALQADGRAVTVACRRPEVTRGWDVTTVAFERAAPGDHAVVVATTPAGATDALAAGGWPAGTALVEVLYAPWPTALAAAAQAAGARVAGGLVVLLGQAVEQVALMTGLAAPVAAMREALELRAGPVEITGESVGTREEGGP